MADEVLIIGGGFAGLAAAVALAKTGRQVRLLEQKPYLGGRARSFADPTSGSTVDNGQHLLMGCYHATLGLLEEIGTRESVALQPHLRMQFLETSERLTTLECPNLPSPWHVLAGVLRSDSFSWREKREILRLGRALNDGKASRQSLDRLTVGEWLTALGQSGRLQRGFWDLLSIAALNEDPRRAAASIFSRVLKLALFTSPADSCLGIPRRGLSDCYADAARAFVESRNGRVETGRNVKAFCISGGICEGALLVDGEKIQAASVISAVPWFEFVRLLPGDLLRAEPYFTNILALRPAPIISMHLWFDRPITALDFAGLRGTTIQWLFNRSKIPGAGENAVSLVISGAHDHISRSKEELLATATRDLAQLLPESRAAKVVHSLVIKERFATFSPCVGVDALRPRATSPIRGLFLAGDWTATGLPATIEGAVRSGQEAAKQVLEEA
ncbi:MAG: hydroxysqualene dehydroxylase HpnE [Terriglobia bacterium]